MEKMEISQAGEAALKRLMEGNERYASSNSRHPHQSMERRSEMNNGQHPFALVLGCSDSRIPPEIIFDQGLGDIFVVRVAGNISSKAVLGSVEYAVLHLRVPLVMVLAHSDCGAVTASLSDAGQHDGHIAGLTAAISPAIEVAEGLPGNAVDNTAKANARMVVDQLKKSEPVIRDFVRNGKVAVVPAFYDLKTGVVDILAH
jgi:carbonic anhydrase